MESYGVGKYITFRFDTAPNCYLSMELGIQCITTINHSQSKHVPAALIKRLWYTIADTTVMCITYDCDWL